jgi:nitroreductase
VEFDLGQTDALLSTTRAVRKRLDLDRAVPREIINECLELAVQAPTASNRQTWRWVVVDDADKRAAIAEQYRAQQGAILQEAKRRAEADLDAQTARVYEGAMWLSEHLHEVPVFVIPCVVGRPPADAPPATLSAIYGSIMPAVWSFQLALRSRGLGSTLTTIHLFREREVAEILRLPDDLLQCALLPVAFTKGTDFKRAARPPVSEITHWNGW